MMASKQHELSIYALGTNVEWLDLKSLLKSQKISTKYNLMFEHDWEEFQIQQLGYYDDHIHTISICQGQIILGSDYFFDKYPSHKPQSVCCIDRFYKTLPSYKKYIEWIILFRGVSKQVVIELDFSICPRTCENFWQLSTNHPVLSYKNTHFHRSVQNIFIEGGLISNEMHSIYNDYFADENFNYLHDSPGVIGMSKTSAAANGTCFYITLRAIPYFNTKNVAFGRVVSGMSTIIEISEANTSHERIIEEITIINTRDLMAKNLSQNSVKETGYRDIVNEVLKYI